MPEKFYTDANGFELIERNTTKLKKDGQPERVSGIRPDTNRFERYLYPVTSAIAFRHNHESD